MNDRTLLFLRRILPAVLLVLLPGCGILGLDSDVKVRAELVRLPGESATAPVGLARAPSAAPPAEGVTSDVTVTSLRIPITLVELRGPGGAGIVLYRCDPGPGEDCLVDLTGPALQNLITTTEVEASTGTYNEVAVGYCGAVAGIVGWNAQMSAQARFDGTTYYTRVGAGLDDTGPEEPLALPVHGCGSGFPIRPELVLTEDMVETVVLRLYFDIRDIAYAAVGQPHLHGISCNAVTDPASSPFVCSAYPTVVALYDGLVPTVERYRINGSSTIGLNFEASSGTFVEAYVRRYFTPGEAWNPGFTPDGFFQTLTPNGDGSYRLERSDVSFPSFRRETHSGTMQTTDLGPVAYTAVRLP
ncbi:MAG TPA: hypothetical protein VM198_04995 [Longimicrobiales bacterium]|nr:hypothetical protein [Longimicrobiales bacterium]